MSTGMPTFGELLRLHRTNAGLSQEALAERARLSANALSALERGERRSPYRTTVDALADALELSDAKREELRSSVSHFRGPRSALASIPESRPRPTPFLPRPPTALVGRRQEMETAQRLLLSGSVRLLTLTGPGGVGKTRLGLEIAESLRQAFRDGVWLVDLALIRDPGLVLSEIARTLELHEDATQPLASALQTYLQHRELLLLLDNFEQVLDAAPDLASLLSAAPLLKIIVTSRTRLRLRWEHLLPVAPLDVRQPIDSSDPAAIGALPAVALFVERATASDPAFDLTSENAATVAALCRQLDGLPLAIELAAARSNVLTPAAMLQHIEQYPAALDWNAADSPPRQRSLRATLTWSLDLLSEAERAVFRRLAVFAGGWTMDALEPVTRANELGFDSVQGTSRLVDASLVDVDQRDSAQLRFSLLETMREFSGQELDAYGERDAVERDHAGYYLALAERAAPGLRGPDQGMWFGILQREQGNLRAALGWAGRHEQVETQLRLAGSLAYFWWRGSYLTEGLTWLDHALGRSLARQDVWRLRALQGAAWLAIHLGKHAAADSWLDEAKLLSQVVGDETGLVRTLGMSAISAFVQGRFDRQSALAAEVDAARATADVAGLAFALGALGDMSLEGGDVDLASDYLEEALLLSRRTGDPLGISIAVLRLARVAHTRGQPRRAAELAAESVAAARRVGNQGSMPGVLYLMLQVSMKLVPGRQLATLMGAAETLQAAGIIPRGLRWQEQSDEQIDTLRARLAPDLFEEAWRQGRAMTVEQFVDATLSAFEALDPA
jgi:predicted ATPase